jgi:hypothetical protein
LLSSLSFKIVHALSSCVMKAFFCLIQPPESG